MIDDIKRFRGITNKMANLYEKKNSNYGNSFEKLYNDLGPIAGLVPLHNKLDRLTNLVKGGHNDFESIEDTLIDLANYAIMNLIELQKNEEDKKNRCSICGGPVPKGQKVCMSCQCQEKTKTAE